MKNNKHYFLLVVMLILCCLFESIIFSIFISLRLCDCNILAAAEKRGNSGEGYPSYD